MLWFYDDGPDYSGCAGRLTTSFRKKNTKCEVCGMYQHCRNCGLGINGANDHWQQASPSYNLIGPREWTCGEHQDEYDSDGVPSDDDGEGEAASLAAMLKGAMGVKGTLGKSETGPWTHTITPGGPGPVPPNTPKTSGIDFKDLLNELASGFRRA